MSSAAARFSRWVNRVLDADGRYICALCDDRFPGRIEAVAHVVAYHPEFAATFADDARGHDLTPIWG